MPQSTNDIVRFSTLGPLTCKPNHHSRPTGPTADQPTKLEYEAQPMISRAATNHHKCRTRIPPRSNLLLALRPISTCIKEPQVSPSKPNQSLLFLSYNRANLGIEDLLAAYTVMQLIVVLLASSKEGSEISICIKYEKSD